MRRKEKRIIAVNAILGAALGFDVGVMITKCIGFLIPASICILTVIAINIVGIYQED